MNTSPLDWFAINGETGELVNLGPCEDFDDANHKAPEGPWIADPETARQWRAVLTSTVRSAVVVVLALWAGGAAAQGWQTGVGPSPYAAQMQQQFQQQQEIQRQQLEMQRLQNEMQRQQLEMQRQRSLLEDQYRR